MFPWSLGRTRMAHGQTYMRVVITGGTGLIGRRLAGALAHDGDKVAILSRTAASVTGLAAGVTAVGWDGKTTEEWSAVVDGADAVVNLAGENISSGRWTPARKRHILESRLNAGRAVVQAIGAASRKPRVLIQASGIGYYGPRDDEITEAMGPGQDFLSNVAVEWEASTAPVEEAGVRRAIIRTGAVLSLDGGALPRLLTPFRFFVGGRAGSGKQWFPWIHLADEVAAIKFLITNDTAHGPFNLTAPAPVTNGELARLIGKYLRRPSIMPIPGFALRFALGEMATLVLEGQRAMPHRLLQSGFAFHFRDTDSALKDLLG
jgi:uncharacterized protein